MVGKVVLLLLLFTAVSWVSGGDPLITVTCRDTADYHTLLYQTCRRSAVCAHLYSLAFAPAQNAPVSADEMHKFAYQVARLGIFTRPAAASLLVPDEWQPPVRVTMRNESGGCSSENLAASAASSSLLFTYSALMTMQNFKMFVADEYLCPEANQQLVLLPSTVEPTFECQCLRGKSCSDASNFATILIVLIAVLLTAVALWIPSIFISLSVTNNRMRALLQQQPAAPQQQKALNK
jgi:hypothetical protein